MKITAKMTQQCTLTVLCIVDRCLVGVLSQKQEEIVAGKREAYRSTVQLRLNIRMGSQAKWITRPLPTISNVQETHEASNSDRSSGKLIYYYNITCA